MSAQQTTQSSTSQAISKGEQRQTGLARRGGFSALPSLWADPMEFFANPFSLMRRMQEEINRTFGQTSPGRGEFLGIWTPPVEVAFRDNKLEVSAELPGLSDQDVKVEVNNDYLIIQGERKYEHQDKEGEVRRSERRYGQFYRAIALPEGSETDKARAEFKDGVLHVSIPVSQEKSNVRQIPVERAGTQQKAA